MHCKYIFLGLLMMTTSVVAQSVYKTIENNGGVEFSDVPTQTSQMYSLNGGNISNFDSGDNSSGLAGTTLVPSAVSSGTVSVSETMSGTPAVAPVYTAINIVQPTDQTVFQNQNPIGVTVATQPALQDGDKIQLILDGKPYGEPQASSSFSISGDIERGTHWIQARIVTATGQSQNVSRAVTIFKRQASKILNSGNAAPVAAAAE
jgi:hypothetical protein